MKERKCLSRTPSQNVIEFTFASTCCQKMYNKQIWEAKGKLRLLVALQGLLLVAKNIRTSEKTPESEQHNSAHSRIEPPTCGNQFNLCSIHVNTHQTTGLPDV